ncbi:AP endonuclease [Lepidopterella palustris CBS 459.81]|uniref:Apurinic-apyrimidinic endonuclease 1 n=1 Tax=Lepidopterella palustris CBS 459.81 TaxID=1314670 RepID=A0A8E2JEZ5_9PEZI|nr:AP endonuclease [Lepidopterella palustris CBS 459.81]
MLRRQSSGLSSAPSDLSESASTTDTTVTTLVETEAKTENDVIALGKKRKAETVTQSSKRAKKVTSKEQPKLNQVGEAPRPSPKKSGKDNKVKKSAAKAEKADNTDEQDAEDGSSSKVQRKRKTKEGKEAEAMPLATRTVGSKLLVGAHVSAAGGVHNSVANCVHIGGNAFALFMKSQRKWANPPLSSEHITLFKQACKTHSISPSAAVPHGSYLVNLAHTDTIRTTQAYDAFLDDLTRCHNLGIKFYNFHPGNSASSSRDEAIAHLAGNLNRAHAEKSTGTVVTLLETMAALGNTIGGTFEDLAAIISLVTDKTRVGVCLDTCHVFAAGYDLRTPKAFKETMEKFDKTIGLKYLKALHINDSKAPFASYRDLHANIGTGFLGLRSFHNIVNEQRLWGLPMVLETPIDVITADGKKDEDKGIWAREIKLLESLVGMDVESEEFLALQDKLQKEGRGERERVQNQVDRKKVKGERGAKKGKARRGKGKGTKKESGSDDEETSN